jgi:hypothetical protein
LVSYKGFLEEIKMAIEKKDFTQVQMFNPSHYRMVDLELVDFGDETERNLIDTPNEGLVTAEQYQARVRGIFFKVNVGVLNLEAATQAALYRMIYPDSVFLFNERAHLEGVDLIPSIARPVESLKREIIRNHIDRRATR